jgi:hypothetical protein
MTRWKPSLKKDSYKDISDRQRWDVDTAYLFMDVELAEDLGSIK